VNSEGVLYLPLPLERGTNPQPDRGGRGASGFFQSERGAGFADCERGGGAPVFPHASR
jgi:hypothetical protein